MPFCLTKLKGDVNAYDIADAIIQGFKDVINLRDYAYTEIIQYFNDASMGNVPLLLQHHLTTLNWEHYWKLMSYKKKNSIAISPNLPIGNMIDKAATNVKAGSTVGILYGFNSPNY